MHNVTIRVVVLISVDIWDFWTTQLGPLLDDGLGCIMAAIFAANMTQL